MAGAPQFAEAYRDLTSEVQALAQRVRMLEGARGPRSFVLKEGKVNTLADLGLTARLERAADGTIADFELRDSSGRVIPLSNTPSRIGDSFRFSLPRGNFEATLSYLLSRRLAKDYIGLRVVPLNP